MAVFGGVAAIVSAGVVLAAGLWLEQGWLAVLGMLLLGATFVAGLVRLGGAPQQITAPARRSALSPDELALPAAGVLAVIGAGVAVVAGIWLEWGWLTVLGMLLVGMAMVATLARASRREQS